MAKPKIINILFRLSAGIAALLLRAKVNYDLYRDRRRAYQFSLLKPGDPSKSRAYFCDGYHGGITFWDWIIIPGGGTWKIYNWPVVAEPILKQLMKCPSLAAVFELDGHTLGSMSLKMPQAIRQMKRAIDTGRLEIVNGTYAQPLAGIFDGETFIRHFYYGLHEIETALSTKVVTFASQEPACFPQLPQILTSFRYLQAILRTHWAPFGTDPSYPSAKIKWQAADGSSIQAIPRYPFMTYGKDNIKDNNSAQVEMHYGLDSHDHFMASHLMPLDFEGYSSVGFESFRKSGLQAGIDRPLLTRLEDFNLLSGAPLKRAASLSASDNISFVTVKQYIKLLEGDAAEANQPDKAVYFSADDFPCYYPWGLQGGIPLNAAQEASHLLLEAERMAAFQAFLSGEAEVTSSKELDQAWKYALQSQHHDLHLCGPWLSRKHNKPMSAVAVDLAAESKIIALEVTNRSLRNLLGVSFKQYFDPAADINYSAAFNSLACRRRDLALLALQKSPDVPASWTAMLNGTEFEGQWFPCGGPGGSLVFLFELPGFSGQTFTVRRKSLNVKQPQFPRKLKNGVHYKNRFYRAQITTDGEIYLEDLENSSNVLKGAYLTAGSGNKLHDSRLEKTDIYQLTSGSIADIYQVSGILASINYIQEIVFFHELPRIDIKVTLAINEDTFIGPQKEESTPQRAYYVQNEHKLNLNFHTTPAETVLAGGVFLTEQRKNSDFSANGFVAFNSPGGKVWSLFRRGSNGFHWTSNKGLLQAVLAWAPVDWLYASADSIRVGGSAYTVLRGNYSYSLSLQRCENDSEALVEAADAYTYPFRTSVIAEKREDTAGSVFSVLPPLNSEAPTVTALFVNDDKIYMRLCNYSGNQKNFSFAGESRFFRPVNLRLEPEGDVLSVITLAAGKIQTLQII